MPGGAGADSADMKLVIGVLLLIVIVVAVNAVLQTAATPQLSVIKGGAA